MKDDEAKKIIQDLQQHIKNKESNSHRKKEGGEKKTPVFLITEQITTAHRDLTLTVIDSQMTVLWLDVSGPENSGPVKGFVSDRSDNILGPTLALCVQKDHKKATQNIRIHVQNQVLKTCSSVQVSASCSPIP